MLWGCFGAKGPGKLVCIKGKMDKDMYLDILKENLQSSFWDLGLSWHFKFVQNNDPKHTAKI